MWGGEAVCGPQDDTALGLRAAPEARLGSRGGLGASLLVWFRRFNLSLLNAGAVPSTLLAPAPCMLSTALRWRLSPEPGLQTSSRVAWRA